MIGTRSRGCARLLLLATIAGGVMACGEVKPQGVRGYTKPPLENPGPFISPEPESEMSELGARPNLPPEVVFEFEDSVLVKKGIERRPRR